MFPVGKLWGFISPPGKKKDFQRRKINRRKGNMLWHGVGTALRVSLSRIAQPSALEALVSDKSLSRGTKWQCSAPLSTKVLPFLIKLSQWAWPPEPYSSRNSSPTTIHRAVVILKNHLHLWFFSNTLYSCCKKGMHSSAWHSRKKILSYIRSLLWLFNPVFPCKQEAFKSYV